MLLQQYPNTKEYLGMAIGFAGVLVIILQKKKAPQSREEVAIPSDKE